MGGNAYVDNPPPANEGLRLLKSRKNASAAGVRASQQFGIEGTVDQACRLARDMPPGPAAMAHSLGATVVLDRHSINFYPFTASTIYLLEGTETGPFFS